MKKIFGQLFCCLLFFSARSQTPLIVTFAGTGVSGHTGDGGPATAAEVGTPSGIAADRFGNIYFTDQNGCCVRKIDTFGIITTVAGGGTTYGDGGPATNAQLNWPEGLTITNNGEIYIADQFHNVIRKVNSVGIITTVAGNNALIGYTGDGGPATAASLWHPADVGVDHAGNIYFVDQDNSVVRKVDAITSVIATVAGTNVAGFSGDGGPATNAKLNFPQGIAVDSAGNVYVADFYNSRIRKIDAISQVITTVAGNGTGGYSGDGGPATNAELYDASAVAVDKNSNIYISDYYNSRIRKVAAATGLITTIAGNDTAAYCCDCHPATAAEIYYPQGVASDSKGNIYIADFGNYRIRKVTTSAACPSLETSGIDKHATGFHIYPNPSDGCFSVEIDDMNTMYRLEVYDFTGNKVFENEIHKNLKIIHLENFPAGVYMVILRSPQDAVYSKITVYK